MTAVPNAPPMARAEKARPVAVERKACGAVNWMHATRSVRGPAQPIPVRAVKMICSVAQLGRMKAKQIEAMNIMAKVAARGVSGGMLVGRMNKDGMGLTHVFVSRCVPCHSKRCEDRRNLVRQLSDGNVPCVVFETDVQDELRCNGVDGGVVDPSLDSKGESRQPEIRSSGEEDVRDDAIRPALPFCTVSASYSESCRE